MVEPERMQIAIWRRVACWISKATRAQAQASVRAPTPTHIAPANTHTHTQKYVKLIAFPRRHWLCERASMLRYTYIACLVNIV
jgi:hypothetical protein